MTKPFDLTGKTALVTGSNTGIGLGIARGLAAAGATVAVHGRNPEKNATALAELKRLNPACRAFVHDLADVAGIPDFYAAVSAAFGGVDILVNNAGINRRGPAEELPLAAIDEVLTVNLRAPFVLAQEFAKERIACRVGGRIIMIASVLSEVGRPTVAPYAASKGGIRQLVRALAVDWAKYGILVNGIGPGYIDTEMNEPLVNDPEFSAFVRQRAPLGRWGTPDDLAGPAVFLASAAAGFVTGQMLYADGGMLASL